MNGTTISGLIKILLLIIFCSNAPAVETATLRPYCSLGANFFIFLHRDSLCENYTFRTTLAPCAGFDQFVYAGGDPVNRWDPSGLDWEWVPGKGGEEGGWRWKANEAAGERKDIIPPEWAVPTYSYDKVAAWYPSGVIPTEVALGSQFSSQPNDPSVKALAQLVGNGVAGWNNWDSVKAWEIRSWFQRNNITDGMAGIKAMDAWYRERWERAAAENEAIRAAGPQYVLDHERLKQYGEIGASLLPGAGLVEGVQDLGNGQYLAAAAAIGSELPWAKIFKAGKKIVNVAGSVITDVSKDLAKSDVNKVMRDMARSPVEAGAKELGHLTTIGRADLPADVRRALADIETGARRNNVERSKIFRNEVVEPLDVKLPVTDGAGNPVHYTEHYVNPRLPGQTHDAKRVITGSDGTVWYTDEHYRSWSRIVP